MDMLSSKSVFRFFLIWIFLSAFYYAGNFFEGQLLVERSDALFHKALKYFLALLLSLLFFTHHKSWKLILQLLIIAAVIVGVSFQASFSKNALITFDVLIILLSFIGFTYAASNFNHHQITSLIKVLIASSMLVALVSYYEYLFMEPILGEYWFNTDGFRSVSTLLNPNNLGIFLGACLLLLVFSKLYKLSAVIPIALVVFGSMLMTGSRTAWICFLFALVIGFLYRGNAFLSYKSTILFLFVVVAIASVFSGLIWMGSLNLPERAVDMHTAHLRLSYYFQYVNGIDWDYLWPDFHSVRTDRKSVV